MLPFPARVAIVEVGPRDGLQNEPRVLPPPARARFVDLLADAGVTAIEVAAFVSPSRVPQMAGAADVFAAIAHRPGVRYSALVPNLTGFERAAAAGATEVAVAAAASETFSQRNINQSIGEALRGYGEVCARASAAGIRVRAYVSTAIACPYEGPTPPARVADLCRALVDLGVFEVAVSDTIGVATPRQIAAVVEAVAARVPIESVALHLHDTRGTALANVYAALQMGIRTFDASCGGLGGCPYAPGASGNLATEDLVYFLDELGMATGISLDGLVEASRYMADVLGHAPPSRVYHARTATSGQASRVL